MSTDKEYVKSAFTKIKNGYEALERTGWNPVLSRVMTQSEKQMKELKYKFSVGLNERNAMRNRYTNVIPYDQNRVIISRSASNIDGYVNASPARYEPSRTNYILAQGPVEGSVTDWWQMMWDKSVSLIIQLNQSGSHDQIFSYFPRTVNGTISFGAFEITTESERTATDYVHRTLKLKEKGGEEDDAKIVEHVNFTSWGDFEVPRSPRSMLALLFYVRRLDAMTSSCEGSPTVVHCSAGIGRTGTFYIVDVVLRMISANIPIDRMDLVELLLFLRRYRPGLIQTPQQLRFAYLAVLEGFRWFLNYPEPVVHTKEDFPADVTLISSEEGSESPRVGKSKSQTLRAVGEKTRLLSAEVSETHCPLGEKSSSIDDVSQIKRKRKEMIERMVEKSRRAEKSIRPFSGRLWGAFAVAAVFSAVVVGFVWKSR
ncbi:unnamed protein product [Caenorhabditis auriculariae]|uniref:protein-tyrosine-phosphatase n=1 Tax=Caenorhabditis auriculariae TaxID=2777116 RepID=A0A8S1GT89_9PELO|nr:unnamed protein product [Caenorhabditis auriculariae]